MKIIARSLLLALMALIVTNILLFIVAWMGAPGSYEKLGYWWLAVTTETDVIGMPAHSLYGIGYMVIVFVGAVYWSYREEPVGDTSSV